jgi:hypothetical protein
MTLRLDFSFMYKNVFRFLLINKAFLSNTHELPILKSLLIYFSVKDLEFLDDERLFNFFYLFNFFFGRRAFITRFSSSFNLNVRTYTFNVQVFFSSKYCYFPLFFLANDLLAVSSYKPSIFFSRNKDLRILFYLRFFDMNLFLEKKTNAGLYYLKDNINFKFSFQSSDLDLCSIFLNFYRLIK